MDPSVQSQKKIVWATLATGAALLLGLALHHNYGVSWDLDHLPMLGSQDALVHLVVVEEFTCPGCKQFSEKILPKLRSHYIESHKAKASFLLVGFTKDARRLGNAALAILHQNQELFFPFIELLFHSSVDHPPDDSQLLFLARQFQTIDLALFAKDLRELSYERELERNFKLAKKIMGKEVHTPAVFVEKTPVKQLTFAAISSVIEEKS